MTEFRSELHEEMDKLFRGILGRGPYSPQLMVMRINRVLRKAGFDVSIELSRELKELPVETVPAVIAHLKGENYQRDWNIAGRMADLVGRKPPV